MSRALCRFALFTASLLAGCQSIEEGAALGDEDEAQRVEVIRALEAGGYDVSSLQFHDDGTVVIEGDMRVPMATVLNDARKLIPKGYGTYVNGAWYTGGTAIHKPIHLVNDPTAPLSAAWVGAVVYGAAADWNSKVGPIFTTAAPKAGESTITLRKGVVLNSSGQVDKCVLAQTASTFPQGNSLNNTITVNSGYDCPSASTSCRKSIEQLSTAMKVRTIAHELGHALGLRHPSVQFSENVPASLIPFTADTNNSSIGTIMRWGCVPDDPTVGSVVEPDDICSFNMLYQCGITGKCSYLPAMPACQ